MIEQQLEQICYLQLIDFNIMQTSVESETSVPPGVLRTYKLSFSGPFLSILNVVTIAANINKKWSYDDEDSDESWAPEFLGPLLTQMARHGSVGGAVGGGIGASLGWKGLLVVGSTVGGVFAPAVACAGVGLLVGGVTGWLKTAAQTHEEKQPIMVEHLPVQYL